MPVSKEIDRSRSHRGEQVFLFFMLIVLMLAPCASLADGKPSPKATASATAVPPIAQALCRSIQTGEMTHLKPFMATEADYLPPGEYKAEFRSSLGLPTPKAITPKQWVEKVNQHLAEDTKRARSVLQAAGLNLDSLTVQQTRIGSRTYGELYAWPYAKKPDRHTGSREAVIYKSNWSSRRRRGEPAMNPKTGKPYTKPADYRLAVDVTDGKKTATVVWVCRRTPKGPRFTTGCDSRGRRNPGVVIPMSLDELGKRYHQILPKSWKGKDQWPKIYQAAQRLMDSDVSLSAFKLVADTVNDGVEWHQLVPEIRVGALDMKTPESIDWYHYGVIRLKRTKEQAAEYEGRKKSWLMDVTWRVTFTVPEGKSFAWLPEQNQFNVQIAMVFTEDDWNKLGKKYTEGKEFPGESIVQQWSGVMTRTKTQPVQFKLPEHTVFRTYRINKGPGRSAIPPKEGGLAIHFVDGEISYIEAGEKRFDGTTPKRPPATGKEKHKQGD